MTRILLIEDDPTIGGELVAALGKDGCAVDWAKDGMTAGKMLVSPEYQAVLLDLALPGRVAFVLLDELRNRGSRVPVIVITSRARVVDRVDALELGANDYVVKPFTSSELLDRLRTVIRRTRRK